MKKYQDLIVWQKAMELVNEVYRIVKLLPKEELFALSDQMRRAAVSIPSNIAEGYNRGSDKEFLHFLHIAAGSKAELETQILISVNLGYLSNENITRAMNCCEEVGKLLNAFISKLTAIG